MKRAELEEQVRVLMGDAFEGNARYTPQQVRAALEFAQEQVCRKLGLSFVEVATPVVAKLVPSPVDAIHVRHVRIGEGKRTLFRLYGSASNSMVAGSRSLRMWAENTWSNLYLLPSDGGTPLPWVNGRKPWRICSNGDLLYVFAHLSDLTGNQEAEGRALARHTWTMESYESPTFGAWEVLATEADLQAVAASAWPTLSYFEILDFRIQKDGQIFVKCSAEFDEHAHIVVLFGTPGDWGFILIGQILVEQDVEDLHWAGPRQTNPYVLAKLGNGWRVCLWRNNAYEDVPVPIGWGGARFFTTTDGRLLASVWSGYEDRGEVWELKSGSWEQIYDPNYSGRALVAIMTDGSFLTSEGSMVDATMSQLPSPARISWTAGDGIIRDAWEMEDRSILSYLYVKEA